MSSLKRHFTAVIGNKEQGTYVSSSPSSAARKAVSKLCANDKKREVKFSVREITQGSDKKVYGPYIGFLEKLDKPVDLEGRIIRYKPVAKLDKEGSKASGKKLKKQAAGVDVRGLSSQQSSIIGNYVGGSGSSKQVEHPLPLFVHKIMISIMDWATQHGVSVNKKDAIAFAQEYASRMPHKMLDFCKPRDVELARAEFEATYQPPQQAQQPRGNQYSHNPDSLFARLREEGIRLGIREKLLNHYLNWYTTLDRISEIAERPSQEDVRVGYEAMVREISHGALMFQEVCTNGLSPATIGRNGFLELMNHNPPNDYMWAFHKCPKLQEVQKRMCFKKCGVLENIGCFIAGMVFNPDGSIGFFKQSMRSNTADPTHQLGLPVVLWITRVGHNVSKNKTSNEGKGMNKKNNNQKPKENQNIDNETREREREREKEKERKQKNRDSRRFSNMNMTLVPSLAKNKKNNGVPRVVGNLTPFHMGEMEYILGNPDYHKACQEAMHRMDGMPVDVIKQGTEASEASFLPNHLNNNPNNNSLNSAQQNPWGAAGE